MKSSLFLDYNILVLCGMLLLFIPKMTGQVLIQTNQKTHILDFKQKAQEKSADVSDLTIDKEIGYDLTNDIPNKSMNAVSSNCNLSSPPPDTSFLGSDKTLNPQDPMGVVGHNHVLTSDNALFRVHNKNGDVLSELTSSTFWSGILSSGLAADPSAAYDHIAERYILIASAFRTVSGVQVIDLLIGVSQTNDPEGLWNLYKLDEEGGHVMNVGFNSKWIATNRGHVFDKSVLYSGATLSYFDLSSTAFGKVSVTLDNSIDDLYVAARGSWPNSNSYEIVKITGSTTAPTGVVVGIVPEADFPYLRGYITPVVQNGSLWLTGMTDCGSFNQNCDAIHWGEIDLSTLNVIQKGTIDEAGYKYNNAAIAVNQNKDVIVGYTIHGNSNFQSAAYSFRCNSDPLNDIRPTHIYKNGENSCSPSRWGDYAIACTDPDGLHLWVLQQAATPSTSNPYTPCDKSFWAKVAPDVCSVAPIQISIKVYLQGAFNSTDMNTNLQSSSLLPLTQPYSSQYTGTENVSSIPANIVDWVLVELRNPGTNVVSARAAFLKKDGTIVDLDGTSPVAFHCVVADNYYVAVRHRNHLGVMTDLALWVE